MIDLDPRREIATPWHWIMSATIALHVEPRLVLVRAPYPTDWRPTLGMLVGEHRVFGAVTLCEVRTLAGDLIHADPSWVTDDVDFEKVTVLRPVVRR